MIKITFETPEEKWEVEVNASPLSNYLTLELIARADVVKIKGETVKDRFKIADRAMTSAEWAKLGIGWVR